MEYSVKTRAMTSFIKDMEHGRYSLRHKLQRKEGQWSRRDQSLLIDSVIRSYPIDPIRTELKDDGVQYIFDGMQRAKTLESFIEDKFKLSRKMDPVTIDGDTYEIGGEFFSHLDPAVQGKLLNYEIQVYVFRDCTEEDIRNMYARQNNGKPHNTVQKFSAIMSDDMSEAVFAIASHSFINKCLSGMQITRSVDSLVALETLLMAMTDKDQIKGFGKSDLSNFIEDNNDKIDWQQVDHIISVMDKLSVAFSNDDAVEISKNSLSMVLYFAYIADTNGKLDAFIDYLKTVFIPGYDGNEEYKEFSTRHTTSADNVHGRMAYWSDVVDSL